MNTNTARASASVPSPATMAGRGGAPARQPRRDASRDAAHAQRIADRMALIEASVPVQRRIVRAGEPVYQAGQRFTHLHVANTGAYKIINLTRDGREQIVSLKFRGDWLGLDGIAEGAHECDAVAMDTGEVWAIPYAALLQACAARPALMSAFHEAMGRELARDRSSLMSVCTLPADARVTDFLHDWATALACRGLRTDQITLRMTRAEVGNYLGLTLETVSRALSRLAREGLIRFADGTRREVVIPDVEALGHFVQTALAPAAALQ
jgi:CRP/FNR family transcriptional regulator, anaerobic regulatory protein